MVEQELDAHLALARFPGTAGATLARIPQGLINQSYLVTAGADRFVLQRVAALFDPAIHDNIAAVTERLATAGMTTPRLVSAADGARFVTVDGRLWRLLSYVAGKSYDRLANTAQAESAGELTGRFHAALEDLPHRFSGMRLGVHDTARHLRTLEEAVASGAGHRLHGEVARLAEAIAQAAATLAPLPELRPIIGHGDLKVSNLRFAGDAALCLIDLDTVGPIALAHELGDAWRSWCNPSSENEPEARFDLAAFGASLRGYVRGLGRPLTELERRALAAGPEWVSLELSARFAADAIREAYFGWDAARFPAAGEHNLLRAQGQWSLFQAIVATRAERAELLGV